MPEVWLTQLDVPASPLEAALRLAREPGLAWLDGGLEHGREGRLSFVAAAPCEYLTGSLEQPSSFALLDRLTAQPGAPREAELRAADVPLWVGHIAYDAAPSARHPSRVRSGACPALRFARYDAWYAYDHQTDRAYLVGDDQTACERLRVRLTCEPVSDATLAYEGELLEATPHEQHRAAIRAALELIREGELYEINLARRYRATFRGSALGLFLRMRALSPVPLGLFIDGGDHALVARSMERFLRLDASTRRLSTSPIKGTLARAGDDAREAMQLLHDPKERAEHAMVVDLMRNDLSRVCELGSVKVSELMTVLPFAGLSHLISTVSGTMRKDVSLRGLLEATFPPGSVTGAPKERVLRAIAALESVPRGVYTGCYGFIDRAGGCSFAVAIRSAVVADGVVDYFAGGGIVADSDPQRESDETDLKAALFLRALERA